MLDQGNESFNKGRFYSAENYYKSACDFACLMCPKATNSSNILASIVVSYQNLAELYFKKNQTSLALSQYQELHEKLVEFSQSQQNTESILMVQKAILKIGTELMYITKKKKINSPHSKQVIAGIIAGEKIKLH